MMLVNLTEDMAFSRCYALLTPALQEDPHNRMFGAVARLMLPIWRRRQKAPEVVVENMEAPMRKGRNISLAGFVTLAVCYAACQQGHSLLEHKLVVTGNQHSIPLFSDEQSFLKISRMKQQGGVEGMAGDVSKNLQTKTIDDQTPVTIVSQDEKAQWSRSPAVR